MTSIAVIGDFVNSKRIPDRARFQRRLATLLESLDAGEGRPVSPYTVTVGDQFQALYDKAGRLFHDLATIISHVHPERLRVAVGLGAVVTGINHERAIGMDGPAFHVARGVMDGLKSHDETIVQIAADTPKNAAALELADRGLLVLSELIRTWKATTWEILRATMTGASVAAIAEALSLTERAVYKNMRTNGVRSVVSHWESVAGLLDAEIRLA